MMRTGEKRGGGGRFSACKAGALPPELWPRRYYNIIVAMRRWGVRVQFESSIFSGRAEVIWTREDHEGEVLLGLKFVLLSRRDRNALHKLLELPQPSRIRSPHHRV